MGLFAQIVILLLVLSCMVMVLLGIRQLSKFDGFDDSEETVHLKEEVEEDGHILSQNSIFSTLVDSNASPKKDEKDYNSNSHEPLSRRE